MQHLRAVSTGFALVLILFLIGGPLPPDSVAAQATGPQSASLALGTAFTYQGQLLKGGAPLTDTCDLRFRLFDDPSAGAQVGLTQTLLEVDVSAGLFTVALDFGQGAFNGDARWLEIAAMCTGDGGFVALDPRQPLTPAPYALALPGLYTQQNATSPNLIGGYSGNVISPTVVGATISGGGSSGSLNRVTDNYGTIGGGVQNRAGDNAGAVTNATHATVGGGSNNVAGNFAATVAGGVTNAASGEQSFIGGGSGNNASGNVATVGGGSSNTADGGTSTVAGGSGNQALDSNATVGGGASNLATANNATVGGGNYNEASGGWATIAGGLFNIASGEYASIQGGAYNQATGDYATVSGGTSAEASHYGEWAYSSGMFSFFGDAQTSLYVLRTTSTTGPAFTELFLDGTSERLTIPTNSVWTFDVLFVARSSTGDDGAGYRVAGVVENAGGTVSIIDPVTFTLLGEDDAAWSVAVTADDTNDALSIRAIGLAATTIRWVAMVRTVQVRF